MTARLEGRTAVVTGGGRGLGRAVALSLARAGAAVWTCARSAPELASTAREIRSAGGQIETRQVDLAEEAACLAFIREVLSRAGRIDTLVNNAGVLKLIPLDSLESPLWSHHLAVNLTAPYLLTRAVLPGMKRDGGSLINVSSRAGVLGFPEETAYCATKFGLEGFTRALACELEGSAVSVNTITPGLRIKPTSLTESAFRELAEEERSGWNDPLELTPAFVLLAELRGEVTGCRFDAHRLSQEIRRLDVELSASRLLELAE